MPKSRSNITGGNTNTENIDVIATKIDYIQADVSDIKTKLESNYATKEWCMAQFGQTKTQVNTIIITFATAIVLAAATFVIRGGLK